MQPKSVEESRCRRVSRVFPTDANGHNTLFGGKLMSYIDDIASLSATRHSRRDVVTASTDSVDFLCPIELTDAVCLESFVSWTGRTSMEVFVKVVAENLLSGERRIAATSFLTFVALDESGHPTEVPQVVPQTDAEIKLYETAHLRIDRRKQRREESKMMASFLTTDRR